MREAAYQDLLNFMKKIDPQATKDSVVKKINNLRSSYRKELKKIKCSQKSGMGTEDAYVPKLWYFNELNFLRDQEEAMEGVSNLDGSDQEELSIDVTSEQNTCSPPTTQVSSAQRFAQQADNLSFSESTPSGPSGAVTSKPFKRAKPLTPTDQLLVTVGQRLKEVKKEDQFDLYGKHVAQKLRLLIPEQRIFAQKLMNDALFEAELGSLHRNASINTGFPLEYGPPSHSSDHSFQSQISVQQHQTNSNYRSTSEEQQSFFDTL
ncbi:uncharacterized protein LOC124168102 [Ischnura elegans]|uniref:uncharacterized protein LOC124168102 n=2 Tax=Ischnura elegans TaxID=197161 RepID=UPI001ED8B5F4|nr:uncharacterized protein LOC124168102 [Ischnura elegans]